MAIALLVYIGEYEDQVDDAYEDVTEYSWSFILGWVAVAVYIISAIIFGVRIFIILKAYDICIGKATLP